MVQWGPHSQRRALGAKKLSWKLHRPALAPYFAGTLELGFTGLPHRSWEPLGLLCSGPARAGKTALDMKPMTVLARLLPRNGRPKYVETVSCLESVDLSWTRIAEPAGTSQLTVGIEPLSRHTYILCTRTDCVECRFAFRIVESCPRRGGLTPQLPHRDL